MSHSNAMGLYARGAAAVAAALTLSGVGGTAQAQQQQQPQPNQNRAPPVQGLYSVSAGATRYATPDGGVRFVFDRSGRGVALVRFEGESEVHVLMPYMAAGGGDIYRNEDGSVMLRVSTSGSVTVYTRTIRTGAPVSEEARVAPLLPRAIAIAEMQNRFRQLQIRASRAVGQPVTFTVPARMSMEAAGVVLDAAERAAEGLADAPITNVRQVIITFGRAPAVALRGNVLIVQVAPEMGYAGRPSSNTIRNVVSGAVQGPQQ